MNILKAGRPTNKKEKAIASVKESDEQIRMNVNIPKSFYKEIKLRALHEDTTVTEIVTKALKEYMSKKF